ncbi:hypothetical protein AB0L10_15960 [Streptomyces flaveolus]|uniref:hypothetical protein n=1 Tax=Streptomyces flaveolus TaxID=67297 RepID=UPI00343B0B75
MDDLEEELKERAPLLSPRQPGSVDHAPPTGPASVPGSNSHRVGEHGLAIAMAVCRSSGIHREPVGKRVEVTVVPADDPGGQP